MNIKVSAQGLHGSVRAIASKSHAHRLLVCAALSDKPTNIECGESSEDIDATVSCLRALGAEIVFSEKGFSVEPFSFSKLGSCVLDCGESGSTLRFLLPVSCALGAEAVFQMRGRLSKRPMSPLSDELVSHGCAIVPSEDGALLSSGKLQSGIFTLPGNISSQFISGLLFALPLLEGDSEIRLTSALESLPYVQMTLDALESFGIDIEFGERCFGIKGNQKYTSPGSLAVEGDWSNAAFWLCAGAIGGKAVTCTGLNMSSKQGDKAVVEILERFGANVERRQDGVTVTGGSLTGIEIDASDTPDLVPVLAATAATARGKTVIFNAERLRIKESDRLRSVTETLKILGADIEETAGGLIIKGGRSLHGGEVSSFGDHRIAMAAAVSSTACDGDVIIKGAEAANKSYPGFFRDFAALGGKYEEENI